MEDKFTEKLRQHCRHYHRACRHRLHPPSCTCRASLFFPFASPGSGNAELVVYIHTSKFRLRARGSSDELSRSLETSGVKGSNLQSEAGDLTASGFKLEPVTSELQASKLM